MALIEQREAIVAEHEKAPMNAAYHAGIKELDEERERLERQLDDIRVKRHSVVNRLRQACVEEDNEFERRIQQVDDEIDAMGIDVYWSSETHKPICAASGLLILDGDEVLSDDSITTLVIAQLFFANSIAKTATTEDSAQPSEAA